MLCSFLLDVLQCFTLALIIPVSNWKLFAQLCGQATVVALANAFRSFAGRLRLDCLPWTNSDRRRCRHRFGRERQQSAIGFHKAKKDQLDVDAFFFFGGGKHHVQLGIGVLRRAEPESRVNVQKSFFLANKPRNKGRAERKLRQLKAPAIPANSPKRIPFYGTQNRTACMAHIHKSLGREIHHSFLSRFT